MVIESADPKQRGKVFEIHKSLDIVGFAIDILLVSILLNNFGEGEYQVSQQQP